MFVSWRRLALWSIPVVLLFAGGLVGVATCAGPPGYYADKYGGPPVDAKPRATRGELRPIRQTEGHTCGFCGLSAIYSAYGLDPVAMDLRFRLGTDKPATWLDATTRGTIPPDILRVVGQDGFEIEGVSSESGEDLARIRGHLAAGHVALALVKVNELHWLVLGDIRGENVLVCDSLRDEAYEEPFEGYVRDRVKMLYLIKPKE